MFITGLPFPAVVPSSRKKSVADEPVTFTMTGFEVVEKEAKPCATSARVLVPRHWIGKRVRAVRIDR
jgi:putative transposon-encoded protein